MYSRSQFSLLKSRIEESRRFIQVIVGPRQIGKTTLVKQVLEEITIPFFHVSADNVPATQISWVSEVWDTVRVKMKAENVSEYLLVIDEIQKIQGWSEVVKKEWDSDSFANVNIKVVLLGSSRVLLEKGLADSLAGRFEEIRMSHWSFAEMRDAFGLTLEQYVYYGGYPGAASLVNDPDRWCQYIESAIVDASINKDILQNNVITKPALLRQAFELGASYSGMELSLTKVIGQLSDAGNTVTISSYLRLLSDAGMLTGLYKYANDFARKRASAPKFQVYNNALRSIYSGIPLDQAIAQPKVWGRFYESAVGAYIVSQAFVNRFDVFYWRDGADEVDFVLQRKGVLVAIEVKSNHEISTSGLKRFMEKYHPKQMLIVGPEGMSVEEFLSMDLDLLFR